MHKNSKLYRGRVASLRKARQALAQKRKAQNGIIDDDQIRTYAEQRLTVLHGQVDRWNRVLEALA